MDIYSLKALCRTAGFKLKNHSEQKRQVVFLGDSLTARCDLKKFYPEFCAVNRGISGDELAHLERRMKCSVYDLYPCAIVFLMGINDLAFYGRSAKEVYALQERVFSDWRKRYPIMPIVVQSLYPVAIDRRTEFRLPHDLNDIVNEVNEGLKDLANKYALKYVDVHSLLLKDGMLDRAFAVDCIHLNDSGYSIVSQSIKSALSEELSGDMLDIYSKGEYPSDALSNFYPHKFCMRGIECASMEGFLQSLKYKNVDKQRKVCALSGKAAKLAGEKRKRWKLSQTLYFGGKRIKRNSAEYEALVCEAYDSLFENPEFAAALKASSGKRLEHSIGIDDPKKTVLTRAEFLDNLIRLRKKID